MHRADVASDCLGRYDVVAKATLAAFVAFAAIGLAPPAFFPSSSAAVLSSSGNALNQIVLIVFSIIAFGICVLTTRRYTLAIPASVLLVILFCWLSLTWSSFAGFGVRRVIALSLGAAVVGYTAKSLHREEILPVLALTMAVIIGVDFVVGAALPGGVQSVSAETVGGSSGWRGLHIDKNSAGAFAGLQVLTATFMLARRGLRFSARALWLVMAILGAAFLWMTESKTSFALVPLVGVLGLGLVLLSRVRVQALTGLGLSALIVAFLWVAVPSWSDTVVSAFNAMLYDPRSFTGRSQIWSFVLRSAEEVPWFGHGYGSFWLTGDNGPVAHYAGGYQRWLRSVPNSHSGYFDLIIQIGYIGLAIGVLAAIALPLVKLIAYRFMDDRSRWLLASMTLFFALHNFLETSLFDRINPVWIIQLIVVAVIYNHGRLPGNRVHFSSLPRQREHT